MAISGFGRDRGGEGGEGALPASAPGNLTAFIDQGSEFEGKLSFKDTVRIDGTFRGEISSENTLIVGESGEIEASIRSSQVVISGSVTGNITAAKQITLHKTARVEGNLETPSVVIEEGAVFNGQLHMTSGSGSKSAASLKAVDGGSGSPQQNSTPSQPSANQSGGKHGGKHGGK
jgi:cytoskeletal protein CcmA (bactofilin family)